MLNSSQITKKLERFPNNGMREASLIEEYDLLDITLSINGTKIRIPPKVYAFPNESNSSNFKLNLQATSPSLSSPSYVTPVFKDSIILDVQIPVRFCFILILPETILVLLKEDGLQLELLLLLSWFLLAIVSRELARLLQKSLLKRILLIINPLINRR